MMSNDFTAHDTAVPGAGGARAPQAADTRPPLPPPPRRAIWPWVLGLLALALVLVALAGTAAVLTVGRQALEGAVIHINGQRWDASMLDVDALGWGVFGITAALAMVALVVLVVVPLSVMLGLAAAALGVGLAMLVVLSVAALVLSPLWLVLLLVWALLRRPRQATPRPAAA